MVERGAAIVYHGGGMSILHVPVHMWAPSSAATHVRWLSPRPIHALAPSRPAPLTLHPPHQAMGGPPAASAETAPARVNRSAWVMQG